MAFIMLRHVPSIPTWVEFLSWMDVEFYQMLFLHLLRWSCGFCLFFHWCGLSLWLICICWIILVTLEWIQLDHGVWSFLCIVRFGLLIFCWGFLCLYSSKILACNFLFLVVSLSGFGIRVTAASWNDFGSVPSSSIFWERLRRKGISSSLYVW